MFKGTRHVLTFVINLQEVFWQRKCMTIGLFGVIKTTCQAMTINLIQLLDKYCLREKNAYEKNEKVKFEHNYYYTKICYKL